MVIALANVEYLVQFKYNGRADAWFMDILLPDETPLRTGIKVVLAIDLFSGWKETERPDGVLVALPKGASSDPPNRDDFARKGMVDLIFVPTDELPIPDPLLFVENPGNAFFDL
jgi:hypothetical protein